MFKDSAIILDGIRRSFLTKSATATMFTLVRVDLGQPNLSLPSTSSFPSRNREYHLKIFERFRAFSSNTSVYVADRPALKQNYMASICSFPTSLTYTCIKKTNSTRQVITLTLSKMNKPNSVFERCLLKVLSGLTDGSI